MQVLCNSLGLFLLFGGFGIVTAADDAAFPETIQLTGETLALNGTGVRKKAFIKIYTGGLYLPEKSSDARAVIDMDVPMVVRLHFIYDGVSPKQLAEAWYEGFEASTGGNTEPIAAHIAAFNSFFAQEAGEGDVYQVDYIPGAGIRVSFNDAEKGAVDGGLAFKKAVFGIWLGDKPADNGLKEGMLGAD